jgi:putative ABC transport system permease protein
MIFDDIRNDVRYGTRTLVRSPGFALVAVLTLTLGIGATTAIFSVVNAVLLRALPYHDPQRLVSFFEDLGRLGYPRTRISPGTYVDLKAQTQIFEDVAVVNETGFNLSGASGSARQLAGVLVTHNLFAVLGVNPMIGTAFLPEEDQPGRDHVVLLSFAFWRNEFAASAGIIGRTIRLNGEPYIVKGVMPADFSFPDNEPNAIDVWVPRAFTSQELNARQARYLFSVGRLRSSVSLATANSALRLIEIRSARQYPADMQGVSRFFAEPLQESYTHGAKAGLLMLTAAVGFILLIACANVANLLLSRAAGRRREITLRSALGAGSGRILRQLLTESALLCAMGAVAGTSVAIGSFAFLKHVIPEDLSRTVVLSFNLPVFGMTILITLASGILCGLAPALEAAKVDLNEALREGGRGSTSARQRLGSVFVAGEMALSLVLLICAGLLLKSFSKLTHVDPGFQTAHLLTLDFDWAEPGYHDWDRRTRFVDRMLAGSKALPGVESVGMSGGLPFTSKGGLRQEVTPEGASAWSEVPDNAIYRVVTPGYLETLRVPLVQGRFFDNRDREEARLVAIVNQQAAKDFWPGRNPVGQRLKLGRMASASPWIQVIGVTGNMRQVGLGEAPRHEIYIPYLQARDSWQWTRFLVLRTKGDPLSMLRALRQVAAGIDPDEPLNHLMTMDAIVKQETHQSSLQTALLGSLAILALTLACVGIYGVMSYLVTQRRQEIGVRMALGARPGQVLGLILKRGMTLTAAGVAIGISASVVLTRLMSSLLFEVSPTDSLVITNVSVMLMAVALVACLIPARRAASIDPMKSLRAE